MTILALQRVKISLRLRNCCKDSIMRIVGNLQVLTGRSRDMLLQAKGDPRDRVHSDQMVLAMIRRGRLVRQSIAQRRPRVSKLEAKRLSGCHPSGQQPRQPDGKARGQIKDNSHHNFQKNTELKPTLPGVSGDLFCLDKEISCLIPSHSVWRETGN